MATSNTLQIRGTLKFPDGQWRRGQLNIAGEKISGIHAVDQQDRISQNVRTVDVGDAFVLPGAVDAHVHSLSHQNEGISAATAAAAAGGVSTIVEMPFDYSGPINNLDRLWAKQNLVNNEAYVDVALLGTLDPQSRGKEAERLTDGGVVGFKASLFDTDSFRFPRTSDFQLLEVLAATRDVGRTLCVHVENNEVINGRLQEERAQGSIDPQSHTRSRPPVSESLGVLTAMEIAADTQSRLHLCHLSLPRSVDLVSWYRGQGADITLETCPHYLTFVQDDLDEQGGHLKINPPLRTSEDRDGLWARLANGDIPVISSDHAPWPAKLKEHDVMLDNKSGAPGVQNVVSLSLGGALRRDTTMRLFDQVVQALTYAPAERYGLDGRKGSLEPGKDADVMVFERLDDAAIELEHQYSNAGWTPYNGVRPGGRITHTFVRGALAYTASDGLAVQPGHGELITSRGV